MSHIMTLAETPSATEMKKKKSQNKPELTTAAVAASIVMPGVIGGWLMIKGSVSVFHHLRQRQLRQLLFDTVACMNESGETWWLDFGALLGIYRDGDLIPHDNDLDLVVLDPDWDMLKAHLAKKFGESRVQFVVPSEDPNVRWLRINLSLGMVDVFGGYDRGGPSIEIDSGRGDLWDIPKAAVLPISEIQFKNHLIKTPGNIQDALRHRYGDTWHIPRYMDKGRDTMEQQKLYARILTALGHIGIRI